MKHIVEEDLIAYQFGEVADAGAIREHLEACPECADTAESIAETLRVFSAGPIPQANLDHAWQRLRGSLPAVVLVPRHRPAWPWLGLPMIALAILLALIATHWLHPAPRPATVGHLAVGPLSETPRDPEVAAHLESAERLLTEVRHSTGPLDEATRRQAHDLLLSNALYVRRANAKGDLAEAAVLDKLDQTLTTLQHEPTGASARNDADHGWHMRLEMNTNGLLLDIRILQQNDINAKESQ